MLKQIEKMLKNIKLTLVFLFCLKVLITNATDLASVRPATPASPATPAIPATPSKTSQNVSFTEPLLETMLCTFAANPYECGKVQVVKILDILESDIELRKQQIKEQADLDLEKQIMERAFSDSQVPKEKPSTIMTQLDNYVTNSIDSYLGRQKGEDKSKKKKKKPEVHVHIEKPDHEDHHDHHSDHHHGGHHNHHHHQHHSHHGGHHQEHEEEADHETYNLGGLGGEEVEEADHDGDRMGLGGHHHHHSHRPHKFHGRDIGGITPPTIFKRSSSTIGTTKKYLDFNNDPNFMTTEPTVYVSKTTESSISTKPQLDLPQFIDNDLTTTENSLLVTIKKPLNERLYDKYQNRMGKSIGLSKRTFSAKISGFSSGSQRISSRISSINSIKSSSRISSKISNNRNEVINKNANNINSDISTGRKMSNINTDLTGSRSNNVTNFDGKLNRRNNLTTTQYILISNNRNQIVNSTNLMLNNSTIPNNNNNNNTTIMTINDDENEESKNFNEAKGKNSPSHKTHSASSTKNKYKTTTPSSDDQNHPQFKQIFTIFPTVPPVTLFPPIITLFPTVQTVRPITIFTQAPIPVFPQQQMHFYHNNHNKRHRGNKKGKKHKKAIMKLLVIGAVIKAKLEFLLKIVATHLQIKFFIIALLGLIVNVGRFWFDLKKGHTPQKVIYYEHAQHQHHYDDHADDGWGGGYWKRSLGEESKSDEETDGIDQRQNYHSQSYPRHLTGADDKPAIIDSHSMAYRGQRR